MQPYNAVNLKAEFHNDPLHLDYAALSGAPGGLQALINNQTGPGSGIIAHEPITGAAFLRLINPNDLGVLTIAQTGQVNIYAGADSVAIGDDDFQSWILGLFTAGNASDTHSALVAAATRTGSRAEVLWGAGTNVPIGDIQDAIPF